MKQRLQRFMIGRYGHDGFSQFLLFLSMMIFIISLLLNADLLYWIGVGLLVYSWYRMLSKNTPKRAQENAVYYQIRQTAFAQLVPVKQRLQNSLATQKTKYTQRKTHRFFHCPKCHQSLRVPRGKGKIEIKCPKCHTTFLGKT